VFAQNVLYSKPPVGKAQKQKKNEHGQQMKSTELQENLEGCRGTEPLVNKYNNRRNQTQWKKFSGQPSDREWLSTQESSSLENRPRTAEGS